MQSALSPPIQVPSRPKLGRYAGTAAAILATTSLYLWLAPGWMRWCFIIAVGSGFLVTQVANLATTDYMHRFLAHRTFQILFRPLLMFFRVVIWTTTGIRPREWAWWHRIHHMFEDTSRDPHSPLWLGFWKVQLDNGAMYGRDRSQPWFQDSLATDPRAGDLRATYDDWDRRFFDHSKRGLTIGITTGYILMAAIDGWLYGLKGILFALIAGGLLLAFSHIVFYLGLSGGVNAICHWFGARPRFVNYARNNWALEVLAMGEGGHNNHHGREWFAGLWASRWERIWDGGYHFLCLFRRLGWVSSWRMPEHLYVPKLRDVSRLSRRQFQQDKALARAA